MTACLEYRRGGATFDGLSEQAVRVLLADAIASIRAREALADTDAGYDRATCLILVGLGRSLGTCVRLTDELEALVERYG